MAKDKGTQVTQTENIPSEEEILREMRQQAKRQQYQKSPKALENRKKYQQKRYEQMKAGRDAIKNLKETNPEKYAELMAKAKAEAAAGKK